MSEPRAQHWAISAGGGRVIGLERPALMGILNVTPDSFSDAGRHLDVERAVARAQEMVAHGAAIIDVGGESTRPGATRVGEIEQAARVVPVIEGIRDAVPGAIVSVDTTRSAVARVALDAGATVINDVSGGTEDPAILRVAADTGAGIVLMHRLRAPDEDRYSTEYGARAAPDYSGEGGVVEAVRATLARLAEAALAAGVARESIALDPGLGFGKTVGQNFALVGAAPRLLELGFPIVCGASRKSFLGRVCGVDEPSARVHGSVAVGVAQYLAGVRVFRVHDVAAHAQALRAAQAIRLGERKEC